jgi:HEAT repeat protein
MICHLKPKALLFSVAVCFFAQDSGSGQERPLTALLQAAKSGSGPERIKAIDEVGAYKSTAASAVGDLSSLLTDKSAEVRAHASHALGEIGEPAKPAAAALTALLKDDDETVRRQAVKALAAIKPGPQVMIPLFMQLMDDPDEGVRQRALRAVSDVGAGAVPGLIEALHHENTAYWACLVLRDIGPEAKDAVPSLIELLKSPKPEIRREAALALGAMREEAAPALAALASLLDDDQVQEAATLALGQIGRFPWTAESTIRKNAKSSNQVLSTLSLWALVRVYPSRPDYAKEAAERLISLLGDKDPFVRSTAARALAALRLNPDHTFPIYERVLEHADDETTQLVLDALATQGSRAIPRLIYALKRDSLRPHAIYILGRMGPEAASAAGPLSSFVGDSNSKVATEAALALAKMGPPAETSIPKLMEALESPDCASAHAIIYALGKFGPSASPTKTTLLKRLSDPELMVISAWALTRIDPNSEATAGAALPALIAGLAAESPARRQLAVDAMAGMKSVPAEAIIALEKTTRDDDKAVRNAATEALRAARNKVSK